MSLSSVRSRMLAILDVVLRVPPVFAMDSLIISGFGGVSRTVYLSQNSSNSNMFSHKLVLPLNSTPIAGDEATYVRNLGWLFLYFMGLVASLAMFLLSTRHLVSIYVWLASVGVILWSYICNEEYVKYVLSVKNSSIAFELLSLNFTAILRFIGNYILQVFLAILFCFASTSSQTILPKRLVGLCFIGPTVLSLLPGISSMILVLAPLGAAAVAFLYVALNLCGHGKHVFLTIYQDIQWSRNIVRHYGLYTLIENQWSRLHVPQVLRVFWLTRLVEQAVMIIADSAHQNYLSSGMVKLTFDGHYLWLTLKELMIRGCETVVAVLGMTSVLSSISHQIGCLMQWFLVVEDPEDRSIGTVSAILFFILALQTGITGMEPEKRFQRLYRNLCLLFTAILHFIHNMVSPLLFSLSASRNMSLNRHSRALLVCLFLIFFPCWFLFYLWSHNPLSTWLLAVSAFSIEVVIKVVISLLIYALFMVDALRTSMWERLDDYVYYIKATGNSIEFVFGIFLFFNGAWILLFESGGTIRALMMCIHAYFNIWLQAKAGWKTFMKRSLAVHKINSLPEASPEQLSNFDDVCAICYQELTSARITRCNHYFHGVCLRKWLYVQDICPLCHESLCPVSDDEADANGAADNREGEEMNDDPLQLHQHND